MYTLTAPSTSSRTLSVLLGRDLSAVDALLQNLRFEGIAIHRWSIASTERTGQPRLLVEFSGQTEVAEEVALRSPGLGEHEILDPEETASLELALITIHASGPAKDEAMEIVGSAGGRLLSLNERGFTAQVSNRPEKIEAMLGSLRRAANVEAVRSGRLSVKRS